jgi:hypothetical protein
MNRPPVDREYVFSSAYHERTPAEARDLLLASGKFFRRENNTGWSKNIPYLLEPDPDANLTDDEINSYCKYIWDLECHTVAEHNADLEKFPVITKPWLILDEDTGKMTNGHPRWMCTDGGYPVGVRRYGE